jgi:hypothetical protein
MAANDEHVDKPHLAGLNGKRPESLSLGVDGSPRLRPQAGPDGLVHLEVSADSDNFSPSHFKQDLFSPKFGGHEVLIDPSDPEAALPPALKAQLAAQRAQEAADGKNDGGAPAPAEEKSEPKPDDKEAKPDASA